MTVSFHGSTQRNPLWWVWRSWLARQIVALEAEGSSPFTHPRKFGGVGWFHPAPANSSPSVLGCSQVVRQGTLTPSFAGSSPAIPATFFHPPAVPPLPRGGQRFSVFRVGLSRGASRTNIPADSVAQSVHPPAGGRFEPQPPRSGGTWRRDEQLPGEAGNQGKRPCHKYDI